MNLAELSVFVGIVGSIVLSLVAARNAEAGFGGYMLAFIVGLAVGVGCAWARWAVERRRRLNWKRPEWQQMCLFPGIMLASTVWMFLTAFLGGLASWEVLRLAF